MASPRIASEPTHASPEPVSIDRVVREATELVAPLAAARRVTVTIQPRSRMRRIASPDARRLRRVLLDLLVNAVVHNRDGGEVSVRVDGDERRLRVGVSVTDPGTPAEVLDRLLSRVDSHGAERSDTGHGLGLGAPDALATAMRGATWADSGPDGSTSWVQLQLVERAVADLVGRDSRRLHAGPWRPADAGRSSVLYVEDNLSNLRLVRYILELRPDVDLVPAMEGRLALERARAHRVSLILLDLQLPDISGEEVLAQLRADQRTRHIPVVVISAHASPSGIGRLLDAGVHAYLTKPFQVREFLAVVDGILCSSRQMVGRPSPQGSGRECEESSGLSTSSMTAAQTMAALRSPPAGRVRR